MSEKAVRRLPVIGDDGRPVGLVSLNDIARYTASAGKKNGLAQQLATTFAAICEPRSHGFDARRATTM